MPIRTRTWTVVAERPLSPQPPYYARPDWWGINDLSFHDPTTGDTVWHQKIPEADIVRKSYRGPDLGYDIDRIGSISVRRTRMWGWLLHIEYTHELAKKAWPFRALTVRKKTVPGQRGRCPHLRGVP